MPSSPQANLVRLRLVMADKFRIGVRMGWVVLVALFTLSLACDAFAADVAPDEKRQAVDEQLPNELKERREFIASFKQRLKNAKTSDEKRALIEEFRSKQETFLKQRSPVVQDGRTPLQRMSEMKAQAKDNPELLARLAVTEERLKSVELIKMKLAEANAANGEQKQKLLDEVRREQTKISQARHAEMEARLQEAKAREVQDDRELPPEMAAVRAKSEARKREVEQLKEALGKASPEERAKLLDDWRKKRQEEMAAVRAQMERIQ